MSVSIPTCLSLSEHLSVSVWLCLLCLSVSLPICLCLSVALSLCVCVCVSTVYLLTCFSLSVCLCQSVSVCLSTCLSMWLLSTYLSGSAFPTQSGYQPACLHVCLSLRLSSRCSNNESTNQSWLVLSVLTQPTAWSSTGGTEVTQYQLILFTVTNYTLWYTVSCHKHNQSNLLTDCIGRYINLIYYYYHKD